MRIPSVIYTFTSRMSGTTQCHSNHRRLHCRRGFHWHPATDAAQIIILYEGHERVEEIWKWKEEIQVGRGEKTYLDVIVITASKKKITTNILKFFCFYSVYSVFVSLLFVKHLLSCLNDNLPDWFSKKAILQYSTVGRRPLFSDTAVAYCAIVYLN